jgi:hypothetical protein
MASNTPQIHIYKFMDVHERQAFLEEETSYDDWGTTLITCGVICLLADLGVGLFVGRDLLDGANFFLRWEIVQTIAGIVLIAAGVTMNRRAHTKDDA